MMRAYRVGLDILGATTATAGATYTDYATVLAVQKALEAKGFHLKKGVDGAYGPDTAQAIKAMQKVLGAEQSGVIDYGVLMALGVSAPAAPSRPLIPPEKPSDGRPAQGWSQPGAMGPAVTPGAGGEGVLAKLKALAQTEVAAGVPVWQVALAVKAATLVGFGVYFLVRK
jgi:peptidoglycan hydrolase-like protein with peptidoglycan-binding domain